MSWWHPYNIRFKSQTVFEPLADGHPLRKSAFRTIVTDPWAGRKWIVHDSNLWHELTRKEDGSWWAFLGFCV